MAVYQQGTPAPVTEDVKKVGEVVRKVVFDVPGRHQEFYLGAKVEAEGDTLKVDLGDNE